MGENSINYLSVLADLKARRDRLNQAIAAVEQIIGELEPRVEARTNTQPAPYSQPSATVYRKMTIGDAAMHFVRSQGKRQSMAAIVKGLRAGGISTKSKNLYTTTYNVLTERAKKTNPEINKIDSQWGLTGWPSEV